VHLRQKFGFRLDSDVKTGKITQLQTRLCPLTTVFLETLGSEQKYFKKFRKATYCFITAAVRETLGIFKKMFLGRRPDCPEKYETYLNEHVPVN
jgi:hypothetical protein